MSTTPRYYPVLWKMCPYRTRCLNCIKVIDNMNIYGHLGLDKQTIAGTSFVRSRNISLGLLCVYCGVLCMNSVCLFWRVL